MVIINVMKRALLTLSAVIFLSSVVKAQSTDTTKKGDDAAKEYVSVEEMPEFPGGMENFYKYLAKYLKYPVEARKNKEQGQVVIQMVVEKDGSLTNIHVITSVSPSLDKEAIRVMSACPRWKSGKQNGYRVRVVYSLPISFDL